MTRLNTCKVCGHYLRSHHPETGKCVVCDCTTPGREGIHGSGAASSRSSNLPTRLQIRKAGQPVKAAPFAIQRHSPSFSADRLAIEPHLRFADHTAPERQHQAKLFHAETSLITVAVQAGVHFVVCPVRSATTERAQVINTDVSAAQFTSAMMAPFVAPAYAPHVPLTFLHHCKNSACGKSPFMRLMSL